MSIVQLVNAKERPRDGKPAAAARDRLLSLVTQIEGGSLDVAEELLADIIAQQHADTRGLTSSEMSVLERLGVTESALQRPAAMTATARSRLWERQSAERSRSVAEAAEILGVTPARVRQRCAAGTLLAQRRSDGWHLPDFQFPDGRELPGWAVVSRAIPSGTPLLLAERVLTSPEPGLLLDGEALAPFEWLAHGGDPARAAAVVDDALHRLP